MKLRPRKGEDRFTPDELREWNLEVVRHLARTKNPSKMNEEEEDERDARNEE